ncbi:MAG: hypothetical protein JNK46_13695 [Methylobacteriaceae bacterium]|nr:hypothetical protein [Methylobacteriaceae bacterium]
MPDFVDELAAEAQAAIAQMQRAALTARAAHARAELLRHMITTARKMAGRPREAALAGVVSEWTGAWGVDRAQDLAVAREMEALTAACLDHVARPDAATDATLRAATEALDAAFMARGTSLADEMAWRSQCAHGWWEAVAPTPADLPGAKGRPDVPRLDAAHPFWEAGCADHCR